ncbi:MAG TPA: response regulator [Pirellulales bacterium]|jgi:two-component system chemotaxis response regulator CheY|nr:response regulator [Pirellulales bacterium]
MPSNTRTVLIVDDSATMRKMVAATLRPIKNVQPIEAANGLEAIERLALMKVDLLVLDLNMPEMHGLEVVAFVRQHQAFREIPIIVLTTRSDEASTQAVLAAGASVYLNKPFDPATLAQHARRLLNVP